MDRKAGRALAKSTIEGLDLFDQIESHEPERLDKPLLVTIHSKSLGMLQTARDDFSAPAEIWISIYVRRITGQGSATEDLFDDVVRATIRALFAAFYPHAANLQIGPSQAGVPDRPIDGKNYRMERFAVRFDDDEE